MGLSKVNGGCQIEKRKKKLQTTKRGVKQQKQKKRLWPTHQYKSRSRFWLGRLLRSRCRRSRCVRRRRSRCRGWSLPCSSPPWVVAGCRCGWFRGRGWLQGSWVVALCWSFEVEGCSCIRHFPPRRHIRHGRHGAAIFNPPRHRYSVAFFQKTATQLRHGATMAAI